jgi:SAM-dependent methyltransferase
VSDRVSADGSPLAVYLALPAGDAPMIVHEAIEGGSSILELGSGPGRATRVLVALGHQVTAVDDSAEMLAHVTGATTVCADIFTLALGQHFDVVLAASHLINTPEPDRREALLRVCVDHLRPGGRVLVERYSPGWLPTAEAVTGRLGPVVVDFQPGEVSDGARAVSVTYRLAGREWSQHFEACDIDDGELGRLAQTVGLRLGRTLDDAETWVEFQRPIS